MSKATRDALKDFDTNDVVCEVLREVLLIPGVAVAVLGVAYGAGWFSGDACSVTDIPFHYIWDKIQEISNETT